MINGKLLGAEAFQSKLKEYFEERGEIDFKNDIADIGDTIIKMNKENSPFFYSEFLKIIKQRDIGLSELLGGNSISELSIIVNQVNQNIRLQEESKKFNNDVNLRNVNLDGSKIIIERLGKIDFSNITIEDIEFIANNFKESVRNMSNENLEEFNDYILKGQKKQVIYNINEASLIYKKYLEGGELTSEETDNFLRFLENSGVKVTNVEEAFNTFGIQYEKIGHANNHANGILKEFFKENLELTEQEFLEIVEKLKKVYGQCETFGFNIETMVCERATDLQNILEKQGKPVKISEYVIEKVGHENRYEEEKDILIETKLENLSKHGLMDVNLEYDNKQPNNNIEKTGKFELPEVIDTDFIGLSDFEIVGVDFIEQSMNSNEQVKTEIELPKGIVENFFNIAFEKPESEYYVDEEKKIPIPETNLIISSEMNPKIPDEELDLKYDSIVNIQQSKNSSTAELKDRVETETNYEIPESEPQKSFLEKMKESNNPFARTFANSISAIMNRGNKRLPSSQSQIPQEAASNPRAFDTEDLAYKNSNKNPRMGIADKALIPASKGLRNSLIDVGEKFMLGLKKVFDGKKMQSQTGAVNIKPVPSKKSNDNPWRVSPDEMNNNTGIYNGINNPVIPKAVNGNPRTASRNKNDDGRGI